MFYIMSEPFFVISPWYNMIYDSLIEEIRKKKLPFRQIDSLYELSYDYIKNAEFAFLIGSNCNWIDEKIKECSQSGIHPIVLSTQQDFFLKGKFSTVTSNLALSVENIITYLEQNGRKSTALYGVNKLSLTNMSLLRQFKKMKSIPERCVYYNDGSVNTCADMILNEIENYDSIVSVNDFATVLLLKKLSSVDMDIAIISYGGTKLAKKYYPQLMTVSMGYENFGKAAIDVCDILKNNSSVDSVVLNVKCSLDNIYFESKQSDSETVKNSNSCDKKFYSDSEINDMIRIENMLLQCDETDSEILNLLLAGYSYEEISDKVFCALNTVKYRVKKIKDLCNCERKKDIVELIGKYSL